MFCFTRWGEREDSHFRELVEAGVEAVVEAHPGGVVCGLDYHPEKEMMLTSSTDGTGKLWVPTGGRAEF